MKRNSGKVKDNRLKDRDRWIIRVELVLLLAFVCAALCRELKDITGKNMRRNAAEEDGWASDTGEAVEVSAVGDYIKWVEFHATCEAMAAAYDLDVASCQEEIPLHWIELLAYVGAKHGGKFDKNSVREIKDAGEKLRGGETTIEKLTEGMEYYEYYLEAYSAVLSGMVGEFSLMENGKWNRYYGLKAFSPVAKGFDYSHYDDFGSSRSYGYSRPHLGHDMMGQIGTPIEILCRI